MSDQPVFGGEASEVSTATSPLTVARDAFMYLLSFLALYLSASGALMIVWGLSNHFFDDPLRPQDSAGLLRAAVSILVVAFPVFAVVSTFIRKKIDTGEIPARSILRKSLIYITLFVISITAIVDLIFVIYAFLGGELTARFLVRGVGVLAIVGLIYWYYQSDLRSIRAADGHGTTGHGAADDLGAEQ